MSGGQKPVQGGVRIKLPEGVTLGQPGADDARRSAIAVCFLPDSCRCPMSSRRRAGKCSRRRQIDEIHRQEDRDLRRFDVDFDLPDRFTPEFPPPIFLTTHPELGDVSHGQLLTIKNYYALMVGILTPVQIEGLRLLLTPFPQEEFNQTEDRKVADQSLGVACLDCHSNFHTNAAFHQTPDVRPQAARFRLDTVSLRGLFNQQIHGSKRSLRSVEDFTQFEQRTAYFNGDQVSAQRKGINLTRQSRSGPDDGANAEHHRLPAGAQARPPRPSRSEQSDATGIGWRARVHGQGPLRRLPRPRDSIHGQSDA